MLPISRCRRWAGRMNSSQKSSAIPTKGGMAPALFTTSFDWDGGRVGPAGETGVGPTEGEV